MSAIIELTLDYLNEISVLFDQYRVFYGQKSDIAAAADFIAARIASNDSKIFMQMTDNEAAGFVQLYPSFSSVAMKRSFYLNDLFVAVKFRNQGVATALIKKAADFARINHATRITLCTHVDNNAAKSLYLKSGFSFNSSFDYLFLSL